MVFPRIGLLLYLFFTKIVMFQPISVFSPQLSQSSLRPQVQIRPFFVPRRGGTDKIGQKRRRRRLTSNPTKRAENAGLAVGGYGKPC